MARPCITKLQLTVRVPCLATGRSYKFLAKTLACQQFTWVSTTSTATPPSSAVILTSIGEYNAMTCWVCRVPNSGGSGFLGGAVCSALFPNPDPDNYPCRYFDASGVTGNSVWATYPSAATYEILTISANFGLA
jgi:hypothetical protein